MPSSICLWTISPTAALSRFAASDESKAFGPSRSTIARISGGRGRLPACVVRMRSVLCFIRGSFQFDVRGSNHVLPARHFFLEVGRCFLRRPAYRLSGQISKALLHFGILQRFVHAGTDLLHDSRRSLWWR